jgi:hypothetical protein
MCWNSPREGLGVVKRVAYREFCYFFAVIENNGNKSHEGGMIVNC